MRLIKGIVCALLMLSLLFSYSCVEARYASNNVPGRAKPDNSEQDESDKIEEEHPEFVQVTVIAGEDGSYLETYTVKYGTGIIEEFRSDIGFPHFYTDEHYTVEFDEDGVFTEKSTILYAAIKITIKLAGVDLVLPYPCLEELSKEKIVERANERFGFNNVDIVLDELDDFALSDFEVFGFLTASGEGGAA